MSNSPFTPGVASGRMPAGAYAERFADLHPPYSRHEAAVAADRCALMARDGHPYERAAPTGRRVAVVGAGPAGLACAHRLALRGHAVTLFDARAKAGGLNEYGTCRRFRWVAAWS